VLGFLLADKLFKNYKISKFRNNENPSQFFFHSSVVSAKRHTNKMLITIIYLTIVTVCVSSFDFNFKFNNMMAPATKKYLHAPIKKLPQIMPNLDLIPMEKPPGTGNNKNYLSDSVKMYSDVPHFAEWMPVSAEDEIQDQNIAGLAGEYHNLVAHNGHGHEGHGNNHGKEHDAENDAEKAEHLSKRNLGHLATSDAHFATIQALEGGSKASEHEHDFEKMDLRLTKRAKRVFNELVEDNKMLHQQLRRLQTHCFS